MTPADLGERRHLIQAEALRLFAGAETVDLGNGVEGIRLTDSDAQAEATVSLPKGTWVAELYLFADDSDHDAVYLYAAGRRLRTYPEELGTVSPAVSTLQFEVTDDKPTPIILAPGETGVCIERIEIVRQ